MTLFTHVLPISVASRAWDCFLADGEILLHRVALAILKKHQSHLLASSFEGCVVFLRNIPEDISEQELVDLIDSIDVPSSLQAVIERVLPTASKYFTNPSD
jgi:hypothetical protein